MEKRGCTGGGVPFPYGSGALCFPVSIYSGSYAGGDHPAGDEKRESGSLYVCAGAGAVGGGVCTAVYSQKPQCGIFKLYF